MSFTAIAGSTLRRDDLRASVSLSKTLSGFSAARILPPIAADKPHGSMLLIPSGAGMNVQNTRRGANGEFPTGTIPLSSATYATESRGFNFRVDQEHAAAYGDKLDMAKSALEFAQAVVLRGLESDVLALINGSTFADSAVSVPWTTYATCQPAADAAVPAQILMRNHGVTKDQVSMYLPGPVAEQLPFAVDVRTRLKIDSLPLAGSLTEQQMAQYFGFKEVIIGRAASNTANYGQTATLAHMGTLTEAFVFVRSEGDVLPSVGVGRMPVWNAEIGVAELQQEIESFGIPFILEEWTIPGTSSTMYQARTHTAPWTIAAGAGRRLTGLA